MASVMDYMLDALPVATAAREVAIGKLIYDDRDGLRRASAAEIRPWLRFLVPGEKAEAYPTTAGSARQLYKNDRFPLIWYLDAGSRPDRVGPGAVRVKEMNLASHLVFESIEWGHLEQKKLVPSINVTTNEGLGVDLPLDDDFLYAQLWTRGAFRPAETHGLHPLKMPIDTGLVRAFVYDLMSDGKVLPLDPATMSDEEAEEWLDTLDAFSALRKGATGDDPKLGERLFRHQALPDFSSDYASASIGDEPVKVRAVGQRFLVTIALTLSRDVFDFEPVGALAATRILPHVHFASTMPCHSVQAACRIVRPPRTTVLSQFGQEGSGHGCHCPDMHQEIQALMVTDTNEVDLLQFDAPVGAGLGGVVTGPVPMWGNLFAYYAVDPSKQFPGRSFTMIPRRGDGREKTRARTGYIERRPPDLLVPSPHTEDSRRTTKVPGQGEFDNLHLAPRMFLEATHARRWGFQRQDPSDTSRRFRTPEPITGWLPLENDRVFLDPIAMAPLCAHDCFHMHWRWSDAVSTKSLFGWNEAGPNAVAGAPMVPPSHSLDLLLPNRHSVILSETARPVAAAAQEVFFHFGAAFGLASDGLKRNGYYSASPTAGANMTATVEFAVQQGDGTMKSIPANSWPAMYWNFRYRLRGDEQSGARAEEYHVHHNLLAAMEL